MLENVCIESTMDYDKFITPLVGNRSISESNLRKLIKSMGENHLASIAIVNRDGHIIDGAHRYRACKELGLPFNYITMPDYGIEEVHILNTDMKNWSNEDFVRQFSDRFMHGEHQYKDYKVLVDFMDSEKLQLNKALTLLEDGKKSGATALRDGVFSVLVDMDKAYENLTELKDLKAELGTALASTVFWQAYVLSKQVTGFKATDFLKKAKRSKDEIDDTKNRVENMLSTFEDVYNDRNRNPISLAFSAGQIYKGSKK